MERKGFSTVELIICLVVVIVLCLVGWGIFKQGHTKTDGQVSSVLVSTVLEIDNSGSTNLAGWSVKIFSDGGGNLACDKGPQLNKSCTTTAYKPGTFPATALSNDLAKTNLSNYKGACVASASFGSTDTLIYHGVSIDGINCYVQTERTPLADDLNKVLAKINLQN